MRPLTHTEAVDLHGYEVAPIGTRMECDRQAGRAAQEGLMKKLNTTHIQGMLRIGAHGERRAYTCTLMVGTIAEYEKALKDAEQYGKLTGMQTGTMQGLMAGREEGHRSGVHTAEAAFRRMPLWRKVYHHFMGF